MSQEKEYMPQYIKESFPKKRQRIYIRERRPFEIFWSEILIMLFIIFMLVMIFMNYMSNLEYQATKTTEEKEISEIDVGIGINKENFSSTKQMFLFQNIKFTSTQSF